MPVAGEAEIDAELARHVRQVVARTDIGEEADAGLRHRQQRLFRHHAIARRRGHADAAAHGDAVHQRHVGLRIAEDAAVHPVFVPVELARELALRPGLIQRADVAAGAERAVAGADDGDGLDLRIAGPGLELPVERQAHLVRQRIERLRPVHGDEPEPPAALEQDFGGLCGGVVVHRPWSLATLTPHPEERFRVQRNRVSKDTPVARSLVWPILRDAVRRSRAERLLRMRV